jgi:hypothetical protein
LEIVYDNQTGIAANRAAGRRAARLLRRGMNSTDNVFYAFSDRNVRDKYANMC